MKSRIDKYLKSAVFEFSLGLPCGHITEMELQKTVFVGQKHEIQSMPNSIPQEDFEALLKSVERNKNKVSRRQSDIAVKSQSSFATSNSGSMILEHVADDKELSHISAVVSDNVGSSSSISDGNDTHLARSWMDLTLLQTWYKLDTNTLPAVYRLLPVRFPYNVMKLRGRHGMGTQLQADTDE
ncbi:uncharacterized protein LOC130420647 isoform X2 [Triplophysa dalaica]|uniref:uncharacterized protein LOC130420647 isoform X2 n=1 Tax=Triplophysa dalaica TaxID=1582913 RepID=UPI0024DF68CE|nr:uncharacterized protein LOC130420647 isoform X2 [Triplophysa dalaica]